MWSSWRASRDFQAREFCGGAGARFHSKGSASLDTAADRCQQNGSWHSFVQMLLTEVSFCFQTILKAVEKHKSIDISLGELFNGKTRSFAETIIGEFGHELVNVFGSKTNTGRLPTRFSDDFFSAGRIPILRICQ